MIIQSPYVLSHSAKGSVWEDHKYAVVVDGVYYYPEGYTKGRVLSDLKAKVAANKAKKTTSSKSTTSSSSGTKTSSQIEALAKDVIRGKYGTGAARKKALGDDYTKVQKRVNELMKKSGSTKVSTASASATKATATAVTNASKSSSSSSSSSKTVASRGLDMDKVFAVYKKKK